MAYPSSSSRLTDRLTVTNDSFIDTPQHAIHIPKGVVSNNYFSGSGYVNGTHADAIGVFGTSGPVLITNNFIDWTTDAGASTPSNNAIRITTDTGNTSNVTVTGNYIIGGTYSLFALPATIVYLPPGGSGTLGTVGTMTNVNISNNYIGFSQFGSIYPRPAPGVTYSNNTTFDFSNPIYAAQAWASYQAAGIPTTHLQVSSGANLTGSAAGSTTLYGAGYLVHLTGTTNETNFVGGLGTQYMNGGAGANIFTYLTFSDSTLQHPDIVSNFRQRQGHDRPEPSRRQSGRRGHSELLVYRHGRLQRIWRPGALSAGPDQKRHLCRGDDGRRFHARPLHQAQRT